jgi:hypothetical protein
MESTSCKLCGGVALFTHQNLILKKHVAKYFRCKSCEFWFIQHPCWLDEAYGESISRLDTGLVGRNIRISKTLSAYIASNFGGEFTGVDWSGGTGLLTRLMRDAGHQYFTVDPFTPNIHARGFDHTPGNVVDLVSLIEVLEHIEYPLDFLGEIIASANPSTIVFTQDLHDGTNSPDWWYFMTDTGQHISFYSAVTLDFLASKLEMTCFKNMDFYVFTKIQNRSIIKSLALNFRLRSLRFLRKFLKERSLTWSDHISLKQ